MIQLALHISSYVAEISTGPNHLTDLTDTSRLDCLPKNINTFRLLATIARFSFSVTKPDEEKAQYIVITSLANSPVKKRDL